MMGGPFRLRGGYIWPIEAAESRPHVQLSMWRLYEVADARCEALSRHLVGYVLEREHAQVSSPVVRVDAESHCCVTRSGRVYELVGAPGHCEEASFTWDAWMHVNGISHAQDVTEDLWRRFQGDSGKTRFSDLEGG